MIALKIFSYQNQFFKAVICNLQHVFELFGNGSWVFQNSLNAGASGVLWNPDQDFALDPLWALQPSGPQYHFQVFKFWQLSPLLLSSSRTTRSYIFTRTTCILGMKPSSWLSTVMCMYNILLPT